MLLGMGFMQQRCFYINSHCDRMLWKGGRSLPLATWENLRADSITCTSTRNQSLEDSGNPQGHAMDEGQERMAYLWFHNFIAFWNFNASLYWVSVVWCYSLMVFFLNLFCRPKYTFPPPVLTFRLYSKEPQGSMTVGPTVWVCVEWVKRYKHTHIHTAPISWMDYYCLLFSLEFRRKLNLRRFQCQKGNTKSNVQRKLPSLGCQICGIVGEWDGGVCMGECAGMYTEKLVFPVVS